ncbi:hypothetical protein LIER_25392 [Lithospermum erythrorhizon]|uniref:Uncharacterized protein n=1 Tax=Lithospermum erythrorhizon TaxID=34254 RepID=A0AAV3R5W4_LITER
MPVVTTHAKYLELPISIGSFKKEVFNSIIDKSKPRWLIGSLGHYQKQIRIKRKYIGYPEISYVNPKRRGDWVLGKLRTSTRPCFANSYTGGETELYLKQLPINGLSIQNTNKVITPVIGEFKDLTVSSLIVHEIGVCDFTKIHALFFPIDSEAMVNLPFNRLDNRDRPI